MSISRIIVLNGPPQVGKDLLGTQIIESGLFTQAFPESFKKPLISMAAALVGMEESYLRENYESLKKRPVLGQLNLREVLIHISEIFIKPSFGSTHMGTLAATRIRKRASEISARRQYLTKQSPLHLDGLTAVFTDSGFETEIAPLLNLVKSHSDIHIIRIHRTGCDYSHCSRSYLDPEKMPSIADCSFYDLHNEATPTALLHNFIETVFMPIRRKELLVA